MFYTFISPCKTFVSNLCHFSLSTFALSNILAHVTLTSLFMLSYTAAASDTHLYICIFERL